MKLLELRKNRKLTQEEVALNTNLTRATYANYETEKTQADIAILIRIADFYGVSLDYLCEHETKNCLNLPPLNNDQILAINMLVRLNTENFKKIFTEISGKFITQSDIAN